MSLVFFVLLCQHLINCLQSFLHFIGGEPKCLKPAYLYFFRCDKSGQGPVHIACHWKLVELLQMLISAKANVNCVDLKGRTPLYICVSSLSTKLYFEDLRHQLPCILTLFRAGCDMLNLVEWLMFKGSGIPDVLLEGADDFTSWYVTQITNPKSLRNICRKVIQMNITNSNLLEVAFKLPLPHSLQMFVARKMFFRENHFRNHIPNNVDQNHRIP